jgi:Bacterial regulatory protein, Fis family
MSKPRRRLTHTDVLFAADQERGNVTRAAARLGVTRAGLYAYLKRYPAVAERFEEWRAKLIDEAETALWDCVAERQPWAIALVLKSQAAENRGWHDGALYLRLLSQLVLTAYGHSGRGAEELLDLLRGLLAQYTPANPQQLIDKQRKADRDWYSDDEAEAPVDEEDDEDEGDVPDTPAHTAVTAPVPPDVSHAAPVPRAIPQWAHAPVTPPPPPVDTRDAEAEALEAEVRSLLAQVKARLGQ